MSTIRENTRQGSALQVLIYVSALIGAFLILVTVHELGHYVVARKLGVQVQRFSIGLGPIVWSHTTKDDVEFALSAIPLGGYISMMDTRTQDVPAHLEHKAFDKVAPWRQISIAAAGPLANLLLAFVLFWIVMFNGIQVALPYVGQVSEQSLAHEAGLRGGEEVVAIDGEPVAQWMDLYRGVLNRVGDTGTLAIDVSSPDSGVSTHQIPIENFLSATTDPDVLGEIGLRQGVLPVVNSIQDDSAAHEAGLLPGDRVLAINNVQVRVWQDLVDIVQASPNSEISILIERDELNYTLRATTESRVAPDGSLYGILGVMPLVESREIGQGVIGSMVYAGSETWNFTVLTVTSIAKMITGQMNASNLAGPITIARLAGEVVQRGWEYYVRLIAMLSISLFLINLLPIPVLDGGHIVYGLIEMVTRRKVSLRVQQIATTAGLAILGCLIILVFYNDLVRLAGG